jgi:hypothetical protein
MFFLSIENVPLTCSVAATSAPDAIVWSGNIYMQKLALNIHSSNSQYNTQLSLKSEFVDSILSHKYKRLFVLWAWMQNSSHSHILMHFLSLTHTHNYTRTLRPWL